jgi:hypothetical protein
LPAFARIGLRANRNFCSEIKLANPIKIGAQKYSTFAFPKFDVRCTRSAPTRGAYRDRHERGAECGGRGCAFKT